MSAKKRKPLGCAMEELVFGDREAETAPTPASVVPPAATPKPSELETLPTLEAALPAPTSPSPEAPAPEPIPVQSKETSRQEQTASTRKRSDGQVYGGYVRRESTANCRCWQQRQGARK